MVKTGRIDITENFYDIAVLLTQLLALFKLFWGSILYKIAPDVYINFKLHKLLVKRVRFS